MPTQLSLREAALTGPCGVAYNAVIKNGRIEPMCYPPDFIQTDPVRRKEELDRQRPVIFASAELGARFCIAYPRIFALLREISFDGWISIEDRDDPAVGVQPLKESAHSCAA